MDDAFTWPPGHEDDHWIIREAALPEGVSTAYGHVLLVPIKLTDPAAIERNRIAHEDEILRQAAAITARRSGQNAEFQ